MEGLLEAVSTSYSTRSSRDEIGLSPSDPQEAALIRKRPLPHLASPADALEVLRNEPDFEALSTTIRFLGERKSDFDITSPSPLAAQLVNVLVSDIGPNYWGLLHESTDESKPKKGKSQKSKSIPELDLLLSCLRSVTGLNAILLKLKQLIQQSKESKQTQGFSNIGEGLRTRLGLLTAILEGDKAIEGVSTSIFQSRDRPAKQKQIWLEFLGLVAGGKVLGITAEAEHVIKDLSKDLAEGFWVAVGAAYSEWIGRNLVHWLKGLDVATETAWRSCAEFMSRSLRIGYTETIIKQILASIISDPKNQFVSFVKLLGKFSAIEQRNILYILLKLLSKDYLSSTIVTEDDSQWWQADKNAVSVAAKFLFDLADGEQSRKDHLLSWLSSPSGAGIGEGIAIRRAAVAALSEDKPCLETLFQKSLQQFGDQLYVRHTPTLQQDVHAQVILLAAGYMHRKLPLRLTIAMRSGTQLALVSNRLAASSDRARFLGMVIGEALSGLVDKDDKMMDFKMEEMKSAEAKWYKGLVNVSDTIGKIEDIRPGTLVETFKKTKISSHKPATKPSTKQQSSKIVANEEIDDDEEEESDNDGLTPYAKSDSDAEDSDEDPTLITRNKPQPPVYIRDLITYLRDTENYDRQKLALTTAPSLIRRKANFGTEVSSHAEELASLLVGLQDKYDIDNVQDMRLQGMIAILIAQPLKMGQWFSKTFFDGDYSISQRASVLTTLGVGARELAGFGSEDAKLTTMSPSPITTTSFPSKSLPPNLHNFYASDTTPLNRLFDTLSNTMIAPMATSIADKVTGPTILKIRTFSSRLSPSHLNRKKSIANALAKIVSDGFFFPLTGRFFMHLRAYGTSSRSNIIFDPHLLSLFIKTLALLIHASGPSTLSLPQMTAEFWDLLLSLRMQGMEDKMVLEAFLFGFLTVLEVNEDKRRLVEGHGRQMLEMQQWVEGVFGRLGGGAGKGGEEDDKVRMMAAACLFRVGEVVEKYQALLMGDMVSFAG